MDGILVQHESHDGSSHFEMRAVSRRAALLIALLLGLTVFAGLDRLGVFAAVPLQRVAHWPALLLLTCGLLFGAAAASVLRRRVSEHGKPPAEAGGGPSGESGGDLSVTRRAVRDASPLALAAVDPDGYAGGGREDAPAGSPTLGGADREAVDPEIVHAILSAASRAADLHGALEAVAAQAAAAFKVPSSAAWLGSAGAASGLASGAGAAIVEAAQRIVRGESGVAAVADWMAPPQEIPANEAELFLQRRIGAGLFIWFTSKHGQTGGLIVASPRPRPWTPAERALGAVAGQVLADAAERLRQLDEAQERIQLLERVRALGLTLTHAASVADVAKTAGEGALSLAGADRAAVYLCQPDGTLSCAWSHNLSEAYVGQVLHHAKLLAGGRIMDGARPDLLELSGRGLDESGPALYPDIEALAPAVAVPRLTQVEGYRALANWPLVYEHKPLGLLSCYFDAPRTWSPAEQDVLQTFAETVAFAVHNGHLHDAQTSRAADLEILFTLSRRLRAARNLEEIYPILIDHAAGLLDADSAAVLLFGAKRSEFECVFAIGTLSEVRGTSFPIAGSPLARVAGEDLIYDTVNLGAEPLPIWMNGFRGLGPAVAAPLRSEREMIGVFCLGRKRRPDAGPFTDAEIRSFEGIAEIGGNAIRRARLFQNLENSYMQMVVSLARTMDARDSYTSGHSERISEWAEAVGRELGCAPEEIQDIRWGALLHDIGKIGVPDAILRKPGKLTDAEWAIMRKHPEIGEEILGSTERMRGVAAMVRHHQEKWNGTGYPDKLKGEEIPLGARILAVCDAYSAITDDRPYKKARTHEDAVEELHRCEGAQFDPRVVAAFCAVVEGHRERDKVSRVR
jgi:putative nucleotidyltransferase with HDIG domain